MVLPLVTFHRDASPSLEAVTLDANPAPEPPCPTLLIQHEDLPQEQLVLRAPENIWLLLGPESERLVPHHHQGMHELEVRTEQGDAYLEATYRAVPAGEEVVPIDLGMVLTLAPAPDGSLALDLAITNHSGQSIHQVEPVFCLGPSPVTEDQAIFSTPAGAISKVRSYDRWRGPDSQWGIFPILVRGPEGTLPPSVGHQASVADEGLIVKENTAVGWAVGVGWDQSFSLSTPGARCLHAHPSILDLPPAATEHRRGRIDLRAGDADQLLERFRLWTP